MDDFKCMLRLCDKCSDVGRMLNIIKSNIFETSDDIDYEKEISYNAWT